MRPTTSQCIDACNVCISHLMDKATHEKNLLRASVSMTEVRKVQKQIYHGIGLKLSTDDFEPSIMFNVLQQCLRDMPDSLLIDIYDDIMKTDMSIEAIQMKSILRSFLPKIPPPQFQLFRSVMMLLYKLTETGVGNDSNAQQISNTFSPYLCRPNVTSFMSIRHVESLQKIKPVIQFIIEYQPDIFRDLKSTVVVRPRVPDATPPVTHPILATSSSFPQHLPRNQVVIGAPATSQSLSISLPSDYSTGSNSGNNSSSIGSNTKKQSPLSVNPIRYNDNSQSIGHTTLDSIETKLEDVELESVVERTVPLVHPLKFHAWEWKVLEDIVFDCSLSFLRRSSRDLDFNNNNSNNNNQTAPDTMALTSTSFSSTESNSDNNNSVERNINIPIKPTITASSASITSTANMVSIHPLSGGLSVLSINSNTNSTPTNNSSSNNITGYSVNDSLNLDDIMHSINNSNTKTSLRRSLSGGSSSSSSGGGNNSPNSNKISKRRKMVMECKSMRNHISQYEEDCLKRLGKIPKVSERNAVINKMYTAYRDKKKEIRDHAATDIQRTFRGMASRTKSGMTLLPGGAALIQSRIRRQDMRQRDGHHRRIRPNSSPRTVPMDTDKADKEGGGTGGGQSQSKSRQDTLEGLLRGNDSRNQWGGKQVGSDASNLTSDNTGSSKVAGKATNDNPQSSELLAKYRALLMQKKDLKRRLKQFDEEFAEKYGRGPKKTDKEVMRPMYQTYHEVKNNLEILRVKIEAMLGKGSLDQEDYENDSVVTKVSTSSNQTSNTSGLTYTVDLSVNNTTSTSDNASLRNHNYHDGQSNSTNSMISGTTTNSAGTSHETMTSTAIAAAATAAVEDHDDDNDMNEINEGEDFSSDSAGNSSRLQALQQEKKTLHAYLKAYEREFNRVHGRQVTKPEDIVPVSAEYQRYKFIITCPYWVYDDS